MVCVVEEEELDVGWMLNVADRAGATSVRATSRKWDYLSVTESGCGVFCVLLTSNHNMCI